MSPRSAPSTALAAIVLVGAIALMIASARESRPPRPSASYAFGHGPTVVLVHGLGSRPEDWLAVARWLARNYRVVLAELPGHGESEMTAPLTLERAAQSLDGTLARETHEPVTLVGHSVGGLVAAQVALDDPARVRSLVLIETALRPQEDDDDQHAMLDKLDHDYEGLIHSAYTSFGRDSAQGAQLAAEAAAQDPNMMKPWIRLALTADISMDVAALRMPVTAVLSDRSWPMDETWAGAAHELGYERVPQIQPVRMQGCGHFVMLDRPSALARVIAQAAGGPGEVSESGAGAARWRPAPPLVPATPARPAP